MVGSINSSTNGAPALGLEQRNVRAPLTLQPRPQGATAPQDAAAASLSDAQAAWRAARDSVDDGLSAIDLALAAGREALARLNLIAETARAGADANALIESYAAGLDAAGADLLYGADLEVAAEPGAAPVVVAGFDARLGAGVRISGDLDGAALARAAQEGAASLQQHLSRLDSVSRGLEAHAAVLGAAANAAGVRGDVDADTARLLALQVRQGLEASGGAIANAQPQSVLALFKV